MLRRTMLLTLGFCCAGSGLATAAEQSTTQNVAWAAYRDLSSSEFSSRFNELRARGMRMIDVEAYSTSGGMRYAMLWQQNDGRGWAEYRDMTSDEYNQRWTDLRSRGYRPTDVEGYMNGGNLRFAGIWVQNRENIAWASYRNLTSSSYGTTFSNMSAAGYYLVDMEAYDTPSGLRYACIWYRNTTGMAWSQLRNMSRSTYQSELNDKVAQGYQLVDYERYQLNGQTRYAAIWHRDGSSRIVRTNRNELGYANYFREYRDDGYRPVDLERDGSNYGAIWVKSNTTLANNPDKPTLDRLLSNYRTANGLPGISAAIVRNGQVVYRSGFGFADQGAGKVAHGETIYPLASVSKVVGGTLFGRLENRRRLANGTAVTISGNDLTRNRVAGLPSRHQHRLRHLLSHTGCVVHYNTTPGLADQTTWYATQTSAVQSLENSPLVTGCTIGSTYSYSTHAFTFLGAAMESVTGRSVPQLVREEIAEPFDLPSMAVMYEWPWLNYDYERSQWYAGGSQISRGNNSWKAFGGGIEANAVDVARFGWLTGSARMTTAGFRDSTLFSRQPNSSSGYAWVIGTEGGRRRASHSGSANGARSWLAVYPDHGLSIAILSNQRGHDGLPALARQMVDATLN